MPVPHTWIVSGSQPNFVAITRTTDKDGKVSTTQVESVQFRLNLASFQYKYRTVPFHRMFQPQMSLTQLMTKFYDDAHSFHAGSKDMSFRVLQEAKVRREVRFEPTELVNQFFGVRGEDLAGRSSIPEEICQEGKFRHELHFQAE